MFFKIQPIPFSVIGFDFGGWSDVVFIQVEDLLVSTFFLSYIHSGLN
jgi:hypothetical protein